MKWGGAALSLVLIGVWVGSAWWGVRWLGVRGNLTVGIYEGFSYVDRVDWLELPNGIRDMVYPRRNPESLSSWVWSAEYTSPRDWGVAVPTWILAVPPLLASATAWRLDTLARRRARVGLCPKCNYNLSGLPPSSPCPECGVR